MGNVGKVLCVFDLDGTLIDSKEAILDSSLKTLQEFGVSDINGQDILDSVGLPISLAFEKYLSGKSLESAVKAFRADLAERGANKTFLYDDTVSLLQKLKSMGVILAVATNKYASLAEEVLRQKGIEGFFATVKGSDTSPAKPSPQMLLELKSEFPEMLLYVMVGDRGEDLIAAQLAGFKGYFVDHGTVPSDSLQPETYTRRVATLGEIAFCLQEDWEAQSGR